MQRKKRERKAQNRKTERKSKYLRLKRRESRRIYYKIKANATTEKLFASSLDSRQQQFCSWTGSRSLNWKIFSSRIRSGGYCLRSETECMVLGKHFVLNPGK